MNLKVAQGLRYYGVAIASTAIALQLSLWLQPLLIRTIGAFFYIAVMVSTSYGGLRAGMVTIVLSTVVLNYYLIPPYGSFWGTDPDDVLRLGIFASIALLISLINARLRVSNRQYQKLNQQIQADSHNRLKMALNAANMGLWDWDLVTGEILWSPEHETLLGLPPGSFDGRYETFDQQMHPQDRDGLNAAITQALQNHTPYQHEYRVIWPDSTVHWVEGRGHAFYDEQGQPLRMSGTIMAIDQRKQAELERTALLQQEQETRSKVEQLLQVLEQERNRLTQILQQMPVGVMVAAVEEGSITFQNEAVHRLLRHPTLVASNLEEYDQYQGFHLDGQPYETAEYPLVRALIQQEVVKAEEMQYIRGDSTKTLLSVSAAPIYDQSGTLIAAVCAFEDILERKQTEAALRQSDARLRLAQVSSNSGVWDWDVQTNTSYWSPEYYLLHQIDSAIAPSYEHWLALIYLDDRDWVQAEIARTLASTTSDLRLEFRVQRPDGIRWFATLGQVFRNATGQPQRVVGIEIDITPQKQAEIALQTLNAELEQRVVERTLELQVVNTRLMETLMEQQQTQLVLWEQSQLLDLAHDTILTLDLNFAITFWNQGAVRMYGWSKTETLGQPIDTLLQTQYPLPLPEIQAELYSRGYWEGELVQQHRNQQPIQVASRWVLQKDDHGQAIKILQINNDITIRKQFEQERQRIEAALRQSETMFRSLSDFSPMGIFLSNPQGVCIYTNRRYQQIVGCSEAEALGEGWREFIHPADREWVFSEWAAVVEAKGEVLFNDLRYCDRQDRVTYTRVRSAPILNDQGEITMFVGMVEDTTEQRQVDQMKQEFISIVSHELRTPLTSIRGALGLIAGGVYDKKPEKMKEMIAIAARQSDRLVRLVSDILDLRRLESGQVHFNRKQWEAAELLQQSADAMRGQADQHQIRLVVEATTAEVWADGDTVIQTLTNLLSNAIKFSPAESTIWLRAAIVAEAEAIAQLPPHPASTSRPLVLFAVQDQGRGIPAAQLESIFGQFQQVDASDSREKGGTGLGLAICRTIVEHQGGKIWVESELGVGSTFYFTLPLSAVPSQHWS